MISAIMVLDDHSAFAGLALLVAPFWARLSTDWKEFNYATGHLRNQSGHELPLDGSPLQMTERQGIEIDYCPTCRGVWLDRGELEKIIERNAIEFGRAASLPPAPPNYVERPQSAPQYTPPLQQQPHAPLPVYSPQPVYDPHHVPVHHDPHHVPVHHDPHHDVHHEERRHHGGGWLGGLFGG